MNWLVFFAGPLGAFINKMLSTASAAFVAWEVAQGVPASSASVIAGGLVTAASAALSAFASKENVKISAINTADNGVKVVPNTSPTPSINHAV